ncbi:methyltransferase domain-containing protein [uncultured Thiohalocapsa sp.]|uniref:methyltransferase domain-containing protein n=1 Tax=uncultured Thiohalocapsa sp. TaxID=768990 RepID=UPI0025DC4746|nr:methyltransferase domain-containing protein [uncultured Thiohalocapsa sp.]
MSGSGGFDFAAGDGYPGFEHRFRGSRASVRTRLGVYLPLVQAASHLAAGRPLLDIGCGRGEWLELMRDAGLVAGGCDADADMAGLARGLGLDVAQGDGLAHLRSQDAGSRAGITAFHVIEHLDLGSAQALVREAFRVLSGNGVLILETPNPENLRVAGCDFYTDPTHHRPLPPRLAVFILEQAGFAAAEVVRLNPSQLHARRLAEAGTDLECDLVRALHGPEDYAIIALKPDADGKIGPELLEVVQELRRWSERSLGLSRPEGDADALQRVIAERDAELRAADAALAECRDQIAGLEETLHRAQRGVTERDTELARLRASLSWRVTAPLRLLWRTAVTLRDAAGLPRLRPGLEATMRRLLPRRLPAAPLISCLCVTRKRPRLLARSIRCFQAQRWPKRELLIVYEDDDAATRAYLRTVTDPMIRTMEVPSAPKKTLGELRNLAIAAARGRWFCQWDDDDWYHADRLSAQWAALLGHRTDACVLLHWLVFDGSTGRAYISPRWHWEGSILCDKRVLNGKLRYASVERAEDTPFVQALIQRRTLAELVRPALYIYVYHSANVWDYDHWQRHILSRSPRALNAADAAEIRAILDGERSVADGSAALDAMLSRIGTDWQA